MSVGTLLFTELQALFGVRQFTFIHFLFLSQNSIEDTTVYLIVALF